MFTLLDAVAPHASWIVEWLQKPEQAAAFIVAVGGAVIGLIVKLSAAVESARRAAREAEVPERVAPMPTVANDETRELLLEVRTLAKRWRQDDAEEKLAQLVPELRATKDALVEARAINAELLRVTEALRSRVAELELDLNVVPIEEWTDEKTPPRGHRAKLPP